MFCAHLFACLHDRGIAEIVCSMADIFHDRAPVMAFLHSVDICMLV